MRRFGAAALDLAWCAAGRFDAYYERGVKHWDVAAGALLCECAGLVVEPLAAGAAAGLRDPRRDARAGRRAARTRRLTDHRVCRGPIGGEFHP